MISSIDALKLAHKNNKQNKFKQWIFILIFIIILLLIFIPFTFYDTYMSSTESIKNSYYNFKYIRIYDGYTEKQFAEILEWEKQYDFITKVEKYNDYGISAYPQNDFLNNKIPIMLRPNIKGNSPYDELIVQGRNLEKNGEMICPSSYFIDSFDGKKLKDGINMDEKIGKKIDTKILIEDDTKEEKDFKYIDRSFELVGTYNAGVTGTFNTCYIIADEYYNLVEDVKLYRTGLNLDAAIYVNHYKDIDTVSNLLDNLGISYKAPTYNTKFIDTVLFLSLVSAIILIIIITIIFIIYCKNYIKDNYKSLTLYKALGFDKKNITKVMILEILETILLATVISLSLTLISGEILQYFLNQYANYSFIVVTVSIMPVAIFLISVIIIVYFLVKSNVKFVDKCTVRELTKENN